MREYKGLRTMEKDDVLRKVEEDEAVKAEEEHDGRR